MTEFMKYVDDELATTIQGTILDRTPIALGSEGQKDFAKVELSGKYTGAKQLSFVEKSFSDKDDALYEIAKCNALRSAGVPVPATSRFFESDGKFSVLYSDLSEGGKYKVWSQNNSISDLQNLHLSDEILYELEDQAKDIAKNASKVGLAVGPDSYFIVEKGENLYMYVADLGMNVRETTYTQDKLQTINEGYASRFFTYVRLDLSKSAPNK